MSATSVAVNSPPTPEKRNKNHLIEDVVAVFFSLAHAMELSDREVRNDEIICKT